MEPTRPNDAIVLGFDRSAKWLIGLVCAALGLGLGAALPWLARLAADLRWMPFSGPIRQFGEWDGTWATAGRLIGGLVVGLAFAAFIVHESPVVTVASADDPAEGQHPLRRAAGRQRHLPGRSRGGDRERRGP